MKYTFITISLILLLVSCKRNQLDKYESLYDIIDELIRFNYYDAGVIVLDLKEISFPVTFYIDSKEDTIKYDLPQPKSPDVITYHISWFEFLTKISIIDSSEMNFFIHQMDTLKPHSLDPTRINKPTISSTELYQFFDQHGIDSTYNILNEKYSNPCFIQFSTPLISSDGNKMIIDVDSRCGELSGGGLRYIFEKNNGKWRIIYSKGTWVS